MIVIGDTLSTRDAIDARVAAGTIVPQLRADDAAGQSAMRSCLATGTSAAECNAQIGASIASNGFFCATQLRIDAQGKTCVANSAPSTAKAAALSKEAIATAAANAGISTTEKVVGGGILLAALAWWLLR